MNQLALPEIGTALEERFERFHADNPHVYELLVQFSREKMREGFTHYSIKGVYERVRWEMPVSTTGEDFKLNNSYTAFYARKVMAECPDLAGFFLTRVQTHN